MKLQGHSLGLLTALCCAALIVPFAPTLIASQTFYAEATINGPDPSCNYTQSNSSPTLADAFAACGDGYFSASIGSNGTWAMSTYFLAGGGAQNGGSIKVRGVLDDNLSVAGSSGSGTLMLNYLFDGSGFGEYIGMKFNVLADGFPAISNYTCPINGGINCYDLISGQPLPLTAYIPITFGQAFNLEQTLEWHAAGPIDSFATAAMQYSYTGFEVLDSNGNVLNDATLTVLPDAPEPGTWWMAGIAAVGFAARRRFARITSYGSGGADLDWALGLVRSIVS